MFQTFEWVYVVNSFAFIQDSTPSCSFFFRTSHIEYGYVNWPEKGISIADSRQVDLLLFSFKTHFCLIVATV